MIRLAHPQPDLVSCECEKRENFNELYDEDGRVFVTFIFHRETHKAQTEKREKEKKSFVSFQSFLLEHVRHF
jgi:hypothetical protein